MVESRRRFLLGTAGAALATAGVPVLTAAAVPAAGPHDGHGGGSSNGGGHGGSINGATFRAGQQVDHAANGFHPDEVLRDFDYGAVSTMPDGRMLREMGDPRVGQGHRGRPGVTFPAWTFDGRIPGPTLRATEGDLMRVRFVNDSEHPHTMHFHGIPLRRDGALLTHPWAR